GQPDIVPDRFDKYRQINALELWSRFGDGVAAEAVTDQDHLFSRIGGDDRFEVAFVTVPCAGGDDFDAGALLLDGALDIAQLVHAQAADEDDEGFLIPLLAAACQEDKECKGKQFGKDRRNRGRVHAPPSKTRISSARAVLMVNMSACFAEKQ